jgi:ketosteroid isomerase-like protein
MEREKPRPGARGHQHVYVIATALGARGKIAAATTGRARNAGMHDQHWWNSLLATIDGKHAHDFAQFLTQDGEFRFGNQPSVHGREHVEAYVAAFFGMIGSSRHELERTWRDGDTRVCEGRVTYTRLDGSQLTVPFANVFYLRGDEIARYLIFIDNGALFAPG